MNFHESAIEDYLKAWGKFMRVQWSPDIGYGPNILGDLLKKIGVTFDDPDFEKFVAAMVYLKRNKSKTYRVLYVLYVDQVDIKKAAKSCIGISRSQIYDLRLDGVVYLSGVIFGAQIAQSPPDEIGPHGYRRWGDLPSGEVLPPKSFAEN